MDDLDYLIKEAKIEALESLREWISEKFAENSTDGYGAALYKVGLEVVKRIDALENNEP